MNEQLSRPPPQTTQNVGPSLMLHRSNESLPMGPAKMLIKNTFITLSDNSFAMDVGRNRTESCDAIYHGPRFSRSSNNTYVWGGHPPGTMEASSGVNYENTAGNQMKKQDDIDKNRKEAVASHNVSFSQNGDTVQHLDVRVTSPPKFDASDIPSSQLPSKTSHMNSHEIKMDSPVHHRIPSYTSLSPTTSDGRPELLEEQDVPLKSEYPELTRHPSPSEETSPSEAERSSSENTIDPLESPDNVEGKSTVMLRNIPNKYTQAMLMEVINEDFSGTYDFFYLPIDFRNKCNFGYAFINFSEPHYADLFWKMFDKRKLMAFKSNKVCAVTWGRVQGLQANIEHYRNSAVMSVSTPQYKPILLQGGVEVSWPSSNKPLPEIKPRYKKC